MLNLETSWGVCGDYSEGPRIKGGKLSLFFLKLDFEIQFLLVTKTWALLIRIRHFHNVLQLEIPQDIMFITISIINLFFF